MKKSCRTGSFHDSLEGLRSNLGYDWNLLGAALCSGAVCRDHWAQAATNLDASTIDQGHAFLLPLLQENLGKEGQTLGVQADLVKGFERHTWCRYQIQIRTAANLSKTLAEHGITSLVFKGLSLATQFYERPGLRPMKDLDLLIQP